MSDMDDLDRFRVQLDVTIRPCREADLPALEWFGLFAAHRPLIRQVFEAHRQGRALMLVAEANGEASGQLWVELARTDGCAVLWALRVLPCLQRRGIGARLIAAAESQLRQRGFTRAEIAVETDNPGARALYERLGYKLAGTRRSSDPTPSLQWILSKELA